MSIKKSKEEKEKLKVTEIDTFNQKFSNSEGIEISLQSILGETDYWQNKSGGKMHTLLTHEAIEKIAKIAGLTVVDYEVKTQPDCYNNYQYTIQAKIVDSKGKILDPQWGEANRGNLGSRGRSNPANMAQKRAFDRTVLKGLGLKGLLSEEELSDESDNNKVDTISPDEAKVIAPVINQVLLAKTRAQLNEFNKKMSIEKGKYTDDQRTAIRKAYQAKIIEINKTKF